jgi:cytochrome c-type biogenesis protein
LLPACSPYSQSYSRDRLTEKQKWYPYVVTLSLALSVVLFTVLLKASTALIDIPPSFWKGLSGGILIALGLVYLFPHAWAWIGGKLGFGQSNVSLDNAQNIGNPLLRAIATGAALGPVFSTCSPTYAFLLATVFPVSVIAGIGYTFVYALGLAIMLTLIILG